MASALSYKRKTKYSAIQCEKSITDYTQTMKKYKERQLMDVKFHPDPTEP